MRESFVACAPVETSDDLVPPRKGFWIGVIPYEALRGIERRRGSDARPAPSIERPRWTRYDAVLRVDHRTGDVFVEADDVAASERLFRAARAKPTARGPLRVRPREGEPASRHRERVGAALDYIARGDVYQVNLARKLDFGFEDAPLDLLAATPAPYGALLELGEATIVSSSPELALEVRGERLRTAPIKGTRPRGTCRITDEAMRMELEASEKERAELVMATDLHRNDLGRVARFGSVRLRGDMHTLTSRTVFSRVQEIVASRADGIDLSTVVEAVLPCGSVTGAPKVRAMEIIAELEADRRGLYTGAIGYVHDGRCVLSMAIRTAVITGDALEYFTGGGIVAGSDPAREVDETNWKASHLVGKKDFSS